MANLPMVGCMTQVSITWDVSDPLGLHLTQEAMKFGQIWLSYGQVTGGCVTQVSILVECLRLG